MTDQTMTEDELGKMDRRAFSHDEFCQDEILTLIATLRAERAELAALRYLAWDVVTAEGGVTSAESQKGYTIGYLDRAAAIHRLGAALVATQEAGESATGSQK